MTILKLQDTFFHFSLKEPECALIHDLRGKFTRMGKSVWRVSLLCRWFVQNNVYSGHQCNRDAITYIAKIFFVVGAATCSHACREINKSSFTQLDQVGFAIILIRFVIIAVTCIDLYHYRLWWNQRSVCNVEVLCSAVSTTRCHQVTLAVLVVMMEWAQRSSCA